MQRIPIEPSNNDAGNFRFSWVNTAELPPLTLEVPDQYQGEIFCDDLKLEAANSAMHWHEKVKVYKLPATASQAARHTIEFNGVIDSSNIPFLAGEFSAAVINHSTELDDIRSIYNLTVRRAREFTLELSLRRNRMFTNKLTGDQGALFYDGAITFDWEFELDCNVSALALPCTSGVCDVMLDGRFAGRMIFEPHTLAVNLAPGKHTLAITLYGSEGALLEGGNARVQLGAVQLLA